MVLRPATDHRSVDGAIAAAAAAAACARLSMFIDNVECQPERRQDQQMLKIVLTTRKFAESFVSAQMILIFF